MYLLGNAVSKTTGILVKNAVWHLRGWSCRCSACLHYKRTPSTNNSWAEITSLSSSACAVVKKHIFAHYFGHF